MERREIIEAIENLGLSSYEAKAYFALLSESPLTGYKLSKNSGVPRSRIYETVEKLTTKGLVLTLEGETTLLKPVSFESFLKKKEKESKQNIDFLKEILPQIKKPVEAQGIWNISGRDQLFENINHLISKSKSHIYLAGYDSDILLLEGALSKAEKREVSVFGVYSGEKIPSLETLDLHQGLPCSSCKDIALSIDSKKAIVGYTFPSDGARIAVTINPGIIHVAEDYIKHEIFLSRMFKTLDKVPSEKLNKLYHEIMSHMP